MSKRTRSLLILLGLSVLVYLTIEVDWSAPGRYYRHYQHLSLLANRKDQIDLAVTRLQERQGKSASMTYSVDTDFQGTFIQTLQVTRDCGQLDDGKLLDDAIQAFKEAGLGKVDRIEYLYGCNAPLPFGMGVDAFDQAFNVALKQHPWCQHVAISSSIDHPSSVTQTWADDAAGVSARLSLDDDGQIIKGKWLDASLAFAEKRAKFRMMVCMTRSAMVVLEPSLTSEQIKSLASDIWGRPKQGASVAVGRYIFDSQMEPLGVTVTRVCKE